MKKIIRFLLVCFYYRFKIIKTIKEAKKRNLTHYKNVYGDSINKYNCRSVWYDEFGFIYRCEQLHN
jgi:hypothetical protein